MTRVPKSQQNAIKLQLMRQVAEGLEFANEHNICHRDIKDDNLMVRVTKTEAHAQIIDLNISKKAENDQSVFASLKYTPMFSAPEQESGKVYSFPVDWFSFGVVLFKLFTGIFPYMSLTDKTKLIRVPPFVQIELAELMRCYLQADP